MIAPCRVCGETEPHAPHSLPMTNPAPTPAVMDYDDALRFLAANTKPEDAGMLGAAIRSIRATARAEGYEQARQDRAASYEDHVRGLRAASQPAADTLDVEALERAIYNAGLQLVEAGKYNVAPAVSSILRVAAAYRDAKGTPEP